MHRKRKPVRRGAASLEVVLVAAVTIPLSAGLLFFAVAVCRYAFAALSGTLSMPFL